MSKKSCNFAAQNEFRMQKRHFIIVLLFFCVGLAGCTYITNPPSEDCKYHAMSFQLPALHENWGFDKKTNQFFYRFKVPELTEEVYKKGNWSVSREIDPNTKQAYQVTLPQSEFIVLDEYDENGELVSSYCYSRYIDYRVSVGIVDIQVTNSDLIYDTDAQGNLEKPEEMHFRLQLIY